jgi:integrase
MPAAELADKAGVRGSLTIIPFFDSAGFKRTMMILTSDLAIKYRNRVGHVLEEGLLPLRSEHMTELLHFTSGRTNKELHMMLVIGFFTGARIGTITTMTVTSLETARPDPNILGIRLLRVGPGTEISTKGSVSGSIMIPEQVYLDLKRYANSTSRLLREAKAKGKDKNLLFLNIKSARYSVDSVNRIVHEMRKDAVDMGMRHFERFRFHQTRATFGTWLMQLLLNAGNKTSAIGIVRDAMLHKNESTTLGYITFLENTRSKMQFASEFNSAFTGLTKRDWNEIDA